MTGTGTRTTSPISAVMADRFQEIVILFAAQQGCRGMARRAVTSKYKNPPPTKFRFRRLLESTDTRERARAARFAARLTEAFAVHWFTECSLRN